MNIEAIEKLKLRGFKVTAKSKMPTYEHRRPTVQVKSHQSVGGSCTLPPQKVYTGTNIVGIATMHKSNAVPVFSQEDAIAISQMRR